MKKRSIITTFLKIAGFTCAAIYTVNKVIGYTSTKNNSLSLEDEGNFYCWKFGNIFYRKIGNGRPLILIHDMSHLASEKEWDRVVSHLSSTHTVYSIDLLGCGRSDKPAITYTNYLYVQMLNDFIKDLIKEPVDFIVSGDSSPLAITTANSSPDYVNRIVMVNPSSVGYSDVVPNRHTKITKKIIESPLIGTFAYYLLNSRTKCFDLTIDEFFTKDDYISYKYSHSMYDASHFGGYGSKYLMASIVGLYTNLPIRRPLLSLSNEVYIIGGENEPNIEDTISSYKAVRPNIVTDIIPNAKHFPHLENSRDFVSAIEKYLG